MKDSSATAEPTSSVVAAGGRVAGGDGRNLLWGDDGDEEDNLNCSGRNIFVFSGTTAKGLESVITGLVRRCFSVTPLPKPLAFTRRFEELLPLRVRRELRASSTKTNVEGIRL